MRILLSTHHLFDRAGSELYVSELAQALRERGHDVRVFTLRKGPVSQALEALGIPVYGRGQLHEVEGFRPEVIHNHHAPTLWVLGRLPFSCPVVFSSLGVTPPLEAPPQAWPGVAMGVGVSEEVLEQLSLSSFGRTVPLKLMRNWFDDRGWTARPPTPPDEVRKIAVVTNHLSPALRQALDALVERRPSVEWVHFGLPHRAVEMQPTVLEPFDLVVTIGRTVLLAGAMGKPCLLSDIHGSDGMLEFSRLPSLAKVNFSGRATRTPISVSILEDACDRAPTIDLASIQNAMLERFRLSTRAAEWEALYVEAINAGTGLDDDSRRTYAGAGLAWEENLNQLDDALGNLDVWKSRVAFLESELLMRQTDLEQMKSLLENSELQLHSVQEALDVAQQALAAPGAQSALRVSEWVRQVANRFAPKGSLRRQVLKRLRGHVS